MISASSLRGLSVVDMNSARKVGEVDDILLDTDSRQLAGYSLSIGHGILGMGNDHILLAQSAVHSIGPDALTVNLKGESGRYLDGFGSIHRLDEVTGCHVVSESGQSVGTIKDVLLMPEDAHIVGYSLEDDKPVTPLDALLGAEEDSSAMQLYVVADADLHFGHDIVIVPDEAVVDRLADDAQSVGETVLSTYASGDGAVRQATLDGATLDDSDFMLTQDEAEVSHSLGLDTTELPPPELR